MRRRAPTPAARLAGFSFLEFTVVIAAIGALIAIAATRLTPYVNKAEEVAITRIEGQLRHALMMEAALRITLGQSGSLQALEASNPMAVLLDPPGTYLGELNAPTFDLLPPRSWHFDTSNHRLVYRASRGASEAGYPARREYVVRLVYADLDGLPGYRASTDEFHGLRLQRLQAGEAIAPPAGSIRGPQEPAARAANVTRD